MAAGVCVSVSLLSWYGFEGVREWQHSSALLTARRANETADLLVTALTRDMRSVQDLVLTSPRVNEFVFDPPQDLSIVVAGAFARFPYPESFFGWNGDADAGAVWFFNRADRPPTWMPHAPASTGFPVTIAGNVAVARQLMTRIARDSARGERFSCFELRLGGADYQIVTALRYRDPLHERLDRVFGFTVNLEWVRANYFPELASEVAHIGSTGAGLDLAIVDDHERVVTSTQAAVRSSQPNRRSFELLFFDPILVALRAPSDLPRRLWFVEVAVTRDPTLSAAINAADRMLGVAAFAAIALAAGLVLTGRAARTAAQLADMRSEFVSTVTHELKTPIATIRAAGDTLASGRISNADTSREYAQMVVQESKRLARLVDNLLAYARIVDLTEAYSFEPVSIHDFVTEVLDRFAAQLRRNGFQVEVDIPERLSVVGDRTALELLFDNLIDNAIRYSDQAKHIHVQARTVDRFVLVEVADRGMGIPEDEIGRVVRKFVRGRFARSGGSGLGLAIASRIATDHGGSLSLASTLGQGTTVTVALPIASNDDDKTSLGR
jgi:signal transduction histidine kinase